MINFTVKKYDHSCKGRIGILHNNNFSIPTPIFWLGHSLKSKLHLNKIFQNFDFPLLISFGDLLDRNKLVEKILETGIHKHLAHKGPILADSGGFKFMSQKFLDVSAHEVIEFYKNAGVSIGVTLDHPMSLSVSHAANKKRWQQTLKTFEKIHRLELDVYIMPVVHGYSLSQLNSACLDIKSIVETPPIIGIGSLVPLLKSPMKNNKNVIEQIEFFADAIDVIKQVFPHSLLHMFGVGVPTTMLPLYALGVDSVDSVSWRLEASYGSILLPGRSKIYFSKSTHSTRKPKEINQEEKDLIADCQCPVCSRTKIFEKRIQMLGSKFQHRAIHNAWVTLQEVSNFRKAMSNEYGKRYLTDFLRPCHRMYSVIKNRL